MCDTKCLQHGLKLGIPGAVFHRCSSKQVFLKLLHIHRKTPALESPLIKLKT